uniref:Chemosensory protein 2 n=1 Tax=Clostera restitura TaxID=2008422 RepID=A0A385XU76_9NEOP|nr:chemosensory protein 2 [Clostera restitura]
MKSVVLCVLGLAALAVAFPGGDMYTDRYDDVNLDEILGNSRLLTPYLRCIMEEGKCTADGKELRSHIREALAQDCAKCTAKQRDGTRRVIGHLINKEPQWWDKLKAKYDAKGLYSKKYESDLRHV